MASTIEMTTIVPVFGYGSLISPINLISKIRDPDTLSEAYTAASEQYVLPEEREAWTEADLNIEYTPALIRGFKRYYSKESVRGGAVLEAVQTGNPDDMMNGVVISNLGQEQYDNITATEPGYRQVTLETPSIEFYAAEDRTTHGNEPLRLFVRDIDPDDLTTTVRRNETYHERILDGIDLLEREYDRTVAEEFLEDFLHTTYEVDEDAVASSEFVTVAENDAKTTD